MSNLYLNNEEQITFSLRSLYEAFGYSRYRRHRYLVGHSHWLDFSRYIWIGIL